MITIHKYDIETVDMTYVDMPAGAIILDVQYQSEIGVVLWARVDTEQPLVSRTFYGVMTGKKLARDPGVYLATIQVGPIDMHYFEFPRIEGV